MLCSPKEGVASLSWKIVKSFTERQAFKERLVGMGGESFEAKEPTYTKSGRHGNACQGKGMRSNLTWQQHRM